MPTLCLLQISEESIVRPQGSERRYLAILVGQITGIWFNFFASEGDGVRR